jgi:hypothetical protein
MWLVYLMFFTIVGIFAYILINGIKINKTAQ